MAPACATVKRIVTEADTAAAYGTSFPPAAATPFVLGLAEVACHTAIADQLAPDQVTVGVRASIEHLAPTPVGGTLTATATETSRHGKRIIFRVEVTDGAGLCAVVEHERAVVATAAILERLETRFP